MRAMEIVQYVEAHEIAHDRDNVWHHTALPRHEFQHRPSLILPIEMNQNRRNKNCTEINYKQNEELI